MIDWICGVIGYTMQNSSYNVDAYVIQGAIACCFVLFVLTVYLLVRFLQWLWGGIK